MFGKKIKLFNLLGFQVSIDLSWIILAVLITWSLSKGLFPQYYEGLSTGTYWIMGIAGMIGLVFSIVFHEFCHSLVARKYGMPMKGITLFIFGGVAEMDDEPISPKAEFLMAIAGPISSIFIGFVFLGLLQLSGRLEWSKPFKGVIGYLMFINFILAGFNLIPAFPLDGGRVLRSALWGWKNDLNKATRISSNFGSAFAVLLMILGVLSILAGNFIGGLWWLLIGLFIKGASQGSYQNLVFRNMISGKTVGELMTTDPVTIPADISLSEAVEEYFYKYHHRMYPVVRDGELVGCLTTRQLQNFPKGLWHEQNVSDIAHKCDDSNMVDVNADAFRLLKDFNKMQHSRLLVVQNGKLKGVITHKDIMDYLLIRNDLEARHA